jgi:hypothetical protein
MVAPIVRFAPRPTGLLAQLNARTLHILPYEAVRTQLADDPGEAFWLAVLAEAAAKPLPLIGRTKAKARLRGQPA